MIRVTLPDILSKNIITSLNKIKYILSFLAFIRIIKINSEKQTCKMAQKAPPELKNPSSIMFFHQEFKNHSPRPQNYIINFDIKPIFNLFIKF